MTIKDRFITKEEFMRLLFTKIDGLDTHELSMWVKSQTDDEWVVVPKTYCNLLLQFIEGFNRVTSREKPNYFQIFNVKDFNNIGDKAS